MAGGSIDQARRYGPWAVITGASSGIGRAFAERLAELGVRVVLVARRRDVLDALAVDLSARYGVETLVVAADLGTEAGLRDVEVATAPLDAGLLIAAAGFATSGRFVEAELASEREMLAVNCWATVAMARLFAERFVARGRGGIVLFASLVGRQGTPYAAHYAATKAYVQTLAEAMRVELAPHGVDVIACAPGPVASGFAGRARMTLGRTSAPAAMPDATLRALGRRDTVVPGALGKFLTASLGWLPRPARVRAMGRIMRAMTAGDGRGTAAPAA